MRVLVDTNILICDAQEGSPLHQKASQSLKTLKTTATELAVVPQVMAEFWNVCTRPQKYRGLGMDRKSISETFDRVVQTFTLYRDIPDAYDHWHVLVQKYDVQGVQVHDARLVAAMISHGLTHILTFNGKDFKRYQEITLLSPETLSGND